MLRKKKKKKRKTPVKIGYHGNIKVNDLYQWPSFKFQAVWSNFEKDI